MSLEEKIKQLAKRPPPDNEQNAKAHAILPILRLLGWSSEDPDRVSFEHTVGTGRVDIALRGKERAVAFVEAKAPRKQLGNHVEQLLNYAFLGGVDICVLTTGIEWWLYLPREKGPPERRRFAVLNTRDDPPDAVAEGLQRYVGREALTSGSAETLAKKALAALMDEERLRTAIPEVWKKMKEEPDSELIALVQGRVRSRTELDAAGSLVAEVLGWAEPVKPRPPQPPHPTESMSIPTRPRKGTKTGRVWELADEHKTRAATLEAGLAEGLNRNTIIASYGNWKRAQDVPSEPGAATSRPAAWSLWGAETPVNSWVKALLGVFTAVYNRHPAGFVEALQPVWGNSKPWVSTAADSLTRPRPIDGSGLYVEANLSAKEIESRCRRLLEHFGHSADELKIILND